MSLSSQVSSQDRYMVCSSNKWQLECSSEQAQATLRQAQRCLFMALAMRLADTGTVACSLQRSSAAMTAGLKGKVLAWALHLVTCAIRTVAHTTACTGVGPQCGLISMPGQS